MNLLYLAHRIPYPPNKGDKIRSYHTLRHLAERHHVWCACFVDDPADMRHAATLRDLCRGLIVVPLDRRRAQLRGLLDLVVDEPASEGFYRSPEMRRRLRDLSQRIDFDAAIFFSSSMGQYAPDIRADRNIIDFCDLDSRKWAELARTAAPPRSWLLRAEARLLAAREHELYERFDATLLISEAEAASWRDHDRDKLHIVGNGVTVPQPPAATPYDSGVVGFVGDMRYAPNADGVYWFTQTIWPRVRETHPWAQFQIVGRGAPRRVRRLASIPGVRVIGEVPDVLPHVYGFQVAIAPLRIARGVQNKVLEAMAAARPVVATAQAAAGIDAVSGKHLIVAIDDNAFARHLNGLLANPHRCAQLGNRARRHVTTAYDWSRQLEPFDALLKQHAAVSARDQLRGSGLLVPA